MMQWYTVFFQFREILDSSVMSFAWSLHQEHPLGSRAELWTLEFQHLPKEKAFIKIISYRGESYFYAFAIVGTRAS